MPSTDDGKLEDASHNSISETSSDDFLVCDPYTGACLPTPPLRTEPRTSVKDETIHSLKTTAHNSKQKKRGAFGKLFSPKSTPLKQDNTLQFVHQQSDQSTSEEITYADIEAAIGKGYVDISSNHFESNALDVLALYIKGQKLLYTEAKTYCEQQLNFLMLPAIFISCVGSIFSFLSSNYKSGPLIIASMNGFNAFLLALISYLKLDAKAQAHKTSAYKFDKLESMCEFNSGRFMFFETSVDEIIEVVDEIEAGVSEIKETNQFILPESIRYEFAFTYSTNIFMRVKKTHLTESSLTHNLKNCVNYIAKLREQLILLKSTDPVEPKMITRFTAAIDEEELRKTDIVNKIMVCRNEYFDLDKQFNDEIAEHMRRVNKWFVFRAICCDWLKS